MTNELSKLKFSSPATRYESIAKYENPKGQQFLIRVSGSSKTEVEQRTKNLRVFLELSTVEPEEYPSNIGVIFEPATETTLSQDMSEFKENESKESTIGEREFSIKVAAVQDIEQPYKLKLSFANNFPDRTINDDRLRLADGLIAYTNQVKAEITVSPGKATFSLYEALTEQGPWKPVKTIEIPDPVSNSITRPLNYPEAVTNMTNKRYFKLMVKGDPGSDYTISGTWNVLA